MNNLNNDNVINYYPGGPVLTSKQNFRLTRYRSTRFRAEVRQVVVPSVSSRRRHRHYYRNIKKNDGR